MKNFHLRCCYLCLVQRFIPAAREALERVDVINQDARFGREADFKLGSEEDIKAKVWAPAWQTPHAAVEICYFQQWLWQKGVTRVHLDSLCHPSVSAHM